MRGSFAWQIVLPVPILIGLALAAAALLLPQAVRTNVQDAALQSATQIAEQFKTIRGYYTQNVVGKVLATGTLKPSIDHKSDPNGIPLPATMIHDLSELLERQDTRLTLFSPFPFANRKDRQLDSFQQEAWSFLKSNPDQVFARQETRDGKEVYRVAVADRMSGETCVGCHNANPNSPKTDWKVGDVRGVLEVVTNIDRQLAAGSTLSNRIVLGGGLVGVALALVTVFFARRVANPIRGLTTAMKRLADGDHDAAIVGLGRKDEIGSMADAVGVFKENAIRVAQLQAEQKVAEARAASEKRQAMQRLADRFEKSVQGFVRDISASAGELEAASRTMSSVAGQTTEKSTIVASAADEASTNVQAVATAAEELTKSIEEISRQVVASSQIANSAVEKATTTNARVESLAEAAQKIGEVVSLISDIAAQTNLLALNATIEAAPAGEAGKGFAVVASEVKNLATQTARATEDISAQVASIQAATGEAVTAIKDISETISSINEYSGSVASAVEEQTAATEEIARNIQQAAQGTSAVTTNIVDVTKAAAESGTAAESVQASAGNVATQSGDLKAATESFLKEIRAA